MTKYSTSYATLCHNFYYIFTTISCYFLLRDFMSPSNSDVDRFPHYNYMYNIIMYDWYLNTGVNFAIVQYVGWSNSMSVFVLYRFWVNMSGSMSSRIYNNHKGYYIYYSWCHVVQGPRALNSRKCESYNVSDWRRDINNVVGRTCDVTTSHVDTIEGCCLRFSQRDIYYFYRTESVISQNE